MGRLIKIKSEGNDVLKKLVNDLDRAEFMAGLNANPDELLQQQQLNEKWTPERWYQEIKKRWYFHPTSWYMRQALQPERLTKEEMKLGCNAFTGCIPQCRFSAPEGRIEEKELQRNILSLTKFIEFMNRPCDNCAVATAGEEEHHHHQHRKEEQQRHNA